MHINGHRVSFHAMHEHIHNDGFRSAVKYLFTGARNIDNAAPNVGEGVTKDTAVNPHASQTVNINRLQAESPSKEYCEAIKRGSKSILQLAADGNMKGEFRITPENDILNSQSASMAALTGSEENDVFEGTGAIIKRFVLNQCKFQLDILNEVGSENIQAQTFMEGLQTKVNSLPIETQTTLKDIFATFGTVLKLDSSKSLKDFHPSAITMICDKIAELPMPALTGGSVDQSKYVLSTATKDAFISYCKDLATEADNTGSKTTMDNVTSA
ncbi:TPA: hypothetical protein MYP48_001707 [Citrobacter freundii]|uniref:hypothetical protein n=1 Tax=Citrobacter freundii TaxID=546 RepID=UPI001BD095CF|nr:hypothetical protein [Citrobacter freundii]HCB1602360.1 hypothetical protein [Citrobacter freundii]HCB1724442.1 hypothetical protein [Citrobacter freundii]HCB1876663.1 hypothetical protein [Citrobacter freundii]